MTTTPIAMPKTVMTINVRQRGRNAKSSKGTWLETTTETIHGPLTGRMLREDIVGGARYLAVRWTGHGVATYIATHHGSSYDGDTYVCTLIHWGL